MNIQAAISKCDMAHAILLALTSYKKMNSANLDVIQSLYFAAEYFLDAAKKACADSEPLGSTALPITSFPPCAPISFRIQLARENLGLSEADLAIQLNTYSDHISDWECGTTELPANMVVPLAVALKCDPMWLLCGTPAVAPNEDHPAPVKVMQGVDVASIGVRIMNRREVMQMDRKALETVAGLPGGTVFIWETGKAIPPSDAIDKLAKALNCRVTWLLTGKGDVSHRDHLTEALAAPSHQRECGKTVALNHASHHAKSLLQA